MHRSLLGRSRSRSLQQLALLHDHHEGVRRVGGRLALEVQTGAYLRDQLQRNLLFEFEGDIRFLGLDVILAARDIKLFRRGFDHGAIHLNRLALDGIPDCVLVLLASVGKNELPGGEVHLVRRA